MTDEQKWKIAQKLCKAWQNGKFKNRKRRTKMNYKYIGKEEWLVELQKTLKYELKPFFDAKIKIITNSPVKYLKTKNKIKTIYDNDTQKFIDYIDNRIYEIKEIYKQTLISKGLVVEVEDE